MINLPKFFKEDDPDSQRFMLPLLPLRDIVVFPHMVAPLFVGREKSVNALTEAMNNDKRVFLSTQKKSNPNGTKHVGVVYKELPNIINKKNAQQLMKEETPKDGIIPNKGQGSGGCTIR